MRQKTTAQKTKTAVVANQYGAHRIILEADERGFVVTAPDLPGVVTWGKDLVHAKDMAREAIELCIECLVKEREAGRSRRLSRARAAIPA